MQFITVYNLPNFYGKIYNNNKAYLLLIKYQNHYENCFIDMRRKMFLRKAIIIINSNLVNVKKKLRLKYFTPHFILLVIFLKSCSIYSSQNIPHDKPTTRMT